MPRNEAQTRAELIDPALWERGWTNDLIRREETAGTIEVHPEGPQRRAGRADYMLRVPSGAGAQPVAVALVEAKPEGKPADHGLEQAKRYAERLHVPFVLSSSGYQFVLYDRFSGLTTDPRPLAELPSPDDLRARYEAGVGFALDGEAAKPLSQPYPGGEDRRRGYQDAAIRAVLERIARGERRALLSLATGAGKTFIAVHLLRRIADAGQLRRALFLCDRDELRTQALAAFQHVFGADAAAVSGADPARNARVLIATYQTLGLDRGGDASFLKRHYGPDFFSHVVIDECHRSAWGDWSEALRLNPNAVQIGLTATPRRLSHTPPALAADDARISADNLAYFGEPAYVYGIEQGIEDGYLAACEVVRRNIFLERHDETEQVTGIAAADLRDKAIEDAITGDEVDARAVAEERARYDATAFERRLLLPDRVRAMADDLFGHLLATGGPAQKTIVFCAGDPHADAVATALNNRYAAWCAEVGHPRAEPYAFKCTAAASGNDQLPDFRGSDRRFFVATTVDLLTTGVDVPKVRNVVFFKYVRSPIAFAQMVGRGTRLHPESGKLLFRVYDYTDATRLFGADFLVRAAATPSAEPAAPDPDGARSYRVEGVEVRIDDAGHLIVAQVDGKAALLPIAEYKARLAARLLAEAPSLAEFRRGWIEPERRRALLDGLVAAGFSPSAVRRLEEMDDYDLYDVLAGLGYGATPRTRLARAGAFLLAEAAWLAGLPPGAARTLHAIAERFAQGGTEELEHAGLFALPAVVKAGGLPALKAAGNPAEVLREAKARMFAA